MPDGKKSTLAARGAGSLVRGRGADFASGGPLTHVDFLTITLFNKRIGQTIVRGSFSAFDSLVVDRFVHGNKFFLRIRDTDVAEFLFAPRPQKGAAIRNTSTPWSHHFLGTEAVSGLGEENSIADAARKDDFLAIAGPPRKEFRLFAPCETHTRPSLYIEYPDPPIRKRVTSESNYL